MGVVATLTMAAIAAAVWWLRVRARGSSASEERFTQDGAGPLPIMATPGPQELTPVEYQWIASEFHAPAIIVRLLDDLAESGAKRSALDLNCGGISRMAPLLQTLPAVATAAAFQSGQFMEVIVNGQLAEAAGGLLHPFARGEGGKISALAKLKDPTALSGAINGALVFQAVSVIVAQKHLADISRKLTELKKDVDDIKEHLEGARRHTILAIIDAIEQRVAEMQAGHLDSHWLGQLNLNDQELVKVQGHLADEINAALAELPKIEEASAWNPLSAADVQQNIEASVARVDRLAGEWFLATQARLAAWAMLCAYPVSREIKAARLTSIQTKAEELLGHGQLHTQLDRALGDRIATIKGIFGDSMWKASARGRRMQLQGQRTRFLGQLTTKQDAIRLSVKLTQERVHQDEQPLRLAVRYEGGQVAEAFELEHVNQQARTGG